MLELDSQPVVTVIQKHQMMTSQNRTNLVNLYIMSQCFRTLRVQIVCQYAATFLSRRYSKRSNTSKGIRYDLIWLEEIDHTLVLGVKAGVPVDFGEIELKAAVAL